MNLPWTKGSPAALIFFASFAVLAALLLTFCGGEKEDPEKSPPAPAVDPPGGPPASIPSPEEPVKSTLPETPPPSAPLPASAIALLTHPQSDPTLTGQILETAKSQNIPLQKITPDQLKTAPSTEFTAIIAPLPLPLSENPQSPIRIPKSPLILVGIPDSTIPLPPHLTHIYPDYRSYGKAAGRETIAHLARLAELSGRAHLAGNIVQIRASDEDPASVQLFEGWIAELEKHPAVLFVHDGPGFWREADAQKRMEEALRIQKNIRAVFAHSTPMAKGTSTAIAAHRTANPGTLEIPVLAIGAPSPDPLSFAPLAEKALEIATRLAADPTQNPPQKIPVLPSVPPVP